MRGRIRPMAVIAISAAVGVGSITSRSFEPPGWKSEIQAAEATRLKGRLARVEGELAGHDLTGLSPIQCANREKNIALLHRYSSAGRFPHNHDFPGRAVPYFLDRHGVPSELAFLMAQSGRQDLVDRIATLSNNAAISDIYIDSKLGPEVKDWLDQAGLSVAEAALIQSSYSSPEAPTQ